MAKGKPIAPEELAALDDDALLAANPDFAKLIKRVALDDDALLAANPDFAKLIKRIEAHGGGRYPHVKRDLRLATVAFYAKRGKVVDLDIGPDGVTLTARGGDADIAEVEIEFAILNRLYLLVSRVAYPKGHAVYRQVDESIEPEHTTKGYTAHLPSSEADDTSRLRMRDDLNIAVKKTKAETLARPKSRLTRAKVRLAEARALATYKALVRHVDLLNPELPEAEKVTRAERLVKAYERLHKANPDFRDTGEQLRAARRIRMADYRRRKSAPQAAQAALG
ncbi:MAG: hypothetical protein ACREET_16910 [Stellaceae bacterium]